MPDGQSYSVTSMSGRGISKINQVLQKVPELVKYKKVFENWDDKKSNIELKSEIQKVLPKAYGLDIQSYQPELQKELDKTREQFLSEAKKKEADLKNILEIGYKQELDKKDEELRRACRVIDVQNAVLSKVYEKNKYIILNVIQDAEITEDELKALQTPILTNR